MNTVILTEYRKARDEGMPATIAASVARYRVKMGAADYPRWPGDDSIMELPRGERIVMKLEYDDDASVTERFNASIDWHPDRWPRDEGAPDWWQDREGRFYFLGYSAYDRGVLTFEDRDPEAEREYYRARGMARHSAWLAVRERNEASARAFRAAMDAGYVGYIVTLEDADGNEVAEESCWGFEANDDYAGTEAYSVAETMAKDRAAHWEAETEKARATMAATRGAFATLARQYREARNIGPAVCDAIRARMETLRAEHRAALAIVAGGAE